MRAIINPLTPTIEIILNATQKIIGYARQLHIIDVINEIRKPLSSALCFIIIINRLAIETNGDRAIIMLYTQERLALPLCLHLIAVIILFWIEIDARVF